MGLSFCSLASGSSGNCYIVKNETGALLIDVGISTRKIHDGLSELGILRNEIRGVLITHEHSDHTKALPVLTKKNPEWDVYASSGTGCYLEDKVFEPTQLHTFQTGSQFQLGGMEIHSYAISHDALDPVCYSISDGASRIMILTDTGIVPEQAKQELKKADLIVLEANHEVNMLKMGPYPYSLKMRILGEQGHLSNETAGTILAEVLEDERKFRYVYLAHLSKENNFPKLAKQTVKNILVERGFYNDKHLKLEVIQREGISCLTNIE